jgi:hypothetical protein
MAAFNKVNSFITAVCAGTHANAINAATDQLDVYLSNATPSASADVNKADLAEIATGNGYTGPQDTTNGTSQTGGTITLTAVDVVINASGAVGPFQYVALFNQTAASDPLWGWWDYGSPVTLANGESFTVNFGASLFTFA